MHIDDYRELCTELQMQLHEERTRRIEAEGRLSRRVRDLEYQLEDEKEWHRLWERQAGLWEKTCNEIVEGMRA